MVRIRRSKAKVASAAVPTGIKLNVQDGSAGSQSKLAAEALQQTLANTSNQPRNEATVCTRVCLTVSVCRQPGSTDKTWNTACGATNPSRAHAQVRNIDVRHASD
eukprot:11835431-Alexandrium_andersonii.AAC.1